MDVTSVGEVIYTEIKRNILAGVYPSGEKLNVDELARTLDASKTPIREALRRLDSEGLVTSKPRVGWSINALNVEEFIDILEFQCALRFFISDNILPYVDKLNFQYLRSINEKLHQLLENRDYFQIIRQNDLFHMTIFSVHPNKTMLRRLNELDALVRLQRVKFFEKEKTFFPSVACNSFEQHQMIIEQLEKHDSSAISRVSKEHFESILEGYKQITQNSLA